jgi:cell division protein FtsB
MVNEAIVIVFLFVLILLIWGIKIIRQDNFNLTNENLELLKEISELEKSNRELVKANFNLIKKDKKTKLITNPTIATDVC